jgi:hypothetical protein
MKNKKELFVHIEDEKNGYFTGYDQYYNKTYLKGNFNKGEWIKVKNYEVKDYGNVKEF